MSTLSIDQRPLEGTRLGRSKFLAGVGAGLLAGATRMWFADDALATDVAPTWPCFGPGMCHACSGYTCTFSGCLPTWPDCNDMTCPSDGDGPYNHQCWTGCDGSGGYYRCCDWKTYYCDGVICICKGWLRSC